MSDSNFNRNRHQRTDNNEQSVSNVHGGEFRKGRLSPYKNHNPQGGDIPNEYIDGRDLKE